MCKHIVFMLCTGNFAGALLRYAFYTKHKYKNSNETYSFFKEILQGFCSAIFFIKTIITKQATNLILFLFFFSINLNRPFLLFNFPPNLLFIFLIISFPSATQLLIFWYQNLFQ